MNFSTFQHPAPSTHPRIYPSLYISLATPPTPLSTSRLRNNRPPLKHQGKKDNPIPFINSIPSSPFPLRNQY
ncbi:hypothetical protein BofuT4_uP157920.1 [Botrytis cinerea T4]|uniref:Uncharacterized protein n=1 Tax=Botryotinia fuckeliana (strain T4) TaxID=999810 RepID=G2YUU8_BOTF4|nr:hypothetical protein BofuT4_uP157920.1 [Botrytis cinerea T4]